MTTTMSPPPPAPPPTPEELTNWIGARPTSPRRRAANILASVWMIGSVLLALIPLGFIAFHVIAKGFSVISWSFLTRNLPIITQLPGGGIWPAIAGTLLLTGMAALMAVPLGVLAAIYLNEYGRQRPTGARHPLHGRRDDRCALDRDGTVRRVDLGECRAAQGVLDVRRRAGARLPDVADRDPHQRRDAEAGVGRPAPRQRRGRRPPFSDGHAGRAPGRAAGNRQRRDARRRRAAGETAPLLFTIGISRAFHFSLGAQNTALPMEIWNNAQQPFPAAQDRAWGAALTLITIVFVLTLIARLVSARFATTER